MGVVLASTFERRLWSKIGPPDANGCWLWTGARRGGYGVIERGGLPRSTTGTHRASYELLVGPIPAGLELDHLCRNQACCNPEHLEPVTSSVNKLRSPLVGRHADRGALRRGVGHHEGGKTHCKRGHPFNEANTYHRPDGHRGCRACREAAKWRYQARLIDRMLGRHRQQEPDLVRNDKDPPEGDHFEP